VTRRADRAVRGRRVDHDPEGRFLQSELEDHRLVLRMYGHRVAHPAIFEDLLAALAALAPAVHDVVRKDRAQLFDGKRMVAADAFEPGQQLAAVLKASVFAYFLNFSASVEFPEDPDFNKTN